ncbi:ABC transporter permease [Marimonas arenosa]|uniref:Transport permease protein n=1 Tax=Marimonas arenosa TaxID=1795305 RepID=A0AAE3WCR8_9RHOB|nr:ABC transporter permease [Marimonas arenosa]MDQ2090060.1 ABC transporter permease [Marimonas arenosa]
MVALPQTRPRPRRFRLLAPRAILALILREMSTTYGRSPGGYLWAVLEPAAGIALLSIIFSLGFRSPPLGSNFAFFYAGGMLPLLMFRDITAKLGQTIIFSRQLLEYPRVTFADALLARLILAVLTQIMVHFVVLATIMSISDVHTTLDFGKMVEAYGLLLVLSAGLGVFNGFLVVAVPLWQTVWAVLTRPLFIISCIFFILESVPQPYRDILWYNPLVHVVGLMRDGYFPFYRPTYVTPMYVIMFGAIPGVLGLLLLKRYHRDLLDR